MLVNSGDYLLLIGVSSWLADSHDRVFQLGLVLAFHWGFLETINHQSKILGTDLCLLAYTLVIKHDFWTLQLLILLSANSFWSWSFFLPASFQRKRKPPRLLLLQIILIPILYFAQDIRNQSTLGGGRMGNSSTTNWTVAVLYTS